MSAPAYAPPVFRTYTLTQTIDAGSPTAEVVAMESHPIILWAEVDSNLHRTATPRYRREVLDWLDRVQPLAEYEISIGIEPPPLRFRIPNGEGAHDEYALIVTREAS